MRGVRYLDWGRLFESGRLLYHLRQNQQQQQQQQQQKTTNPTNLQISFDVIIFLF